ncbi:MAG: histidine--tRNA ligase [Clostridia bacterium]|nr:histidine--tRNA ligase [Clostridia bacterium]
MIQKPRGTMDLLPEVTPTWRFVEQTCRDTARRFGFEEIRVPTFEASELYRRGVGEGTDVVQKEMYDFFDKDGRSMTLRPEGTAGVARAVIENSLYAGAMPLKLSYLVSCFRYELPQAGRSREFYQFGVECFGASDPKCDAEVILLAAEIFKALDIKVRLELNSIGCPECRAKYLEALKAYFATKTDVLCETCQGRLSRNALRVLDCKSPICKEVAAGAPKILDFLCEDCKASFDATCKTLSDCGLEYTVNPQIVRGLDYYRGVVFEFISDDIGAQSTVCGGGRYDGLIESLGGPALPGIGFGMGLTRIMLCLKAKQQQVERATPDLYIASIGDGARDFSFLLAQSLRERGLYVVSDIVGRSLKAQMKYADKCGAKFAIVLGDDELANKAARLRPMRGGDEVEIDLTDPDALISLLKGE